MTKPAAPSRPKRATKPMPEVPRRGRGGSKPKRGVKARERFEMKLTPLESAALSTAAELAGQSVAAYIRQALAQRMGGLWPAQPRY